MFDTFSCSYDQIDANCEFTQANQKDTDNLALESHRAPAQFIIPDEEEMKTRFDDNRQSMLTELPELKLPSPEVKPTLLKQQFSYTSQNQDMFSSP